MDQSDVEQIASSYLRSLSESYDLRLQHSQLTTESDLVNLINTTVSPATQLSTSHLPALKAFLEAPDEDTLSYQDAIRAMTPDQSCDTGSGASVMGRAGYE